MFLHRFADSTVEMGEMVDKGAGEDVKGDQGGPLGVGEAAEKAAQRGHLDWGLENVQMNAREATSVELRSPDSID